VSKLWLSLDDSAPDMAGTFSADIWTGDGTTRNITTGVAPDMVIVKSRSAVASPSEYDSLRGAGDRLQLDATSGPLPGNNAVSAFLSNGFTVTNNAASNAAAVTYVGYSVRKVLGFFSTVNSTSPAGAKRHYLGNVPGMIWYKPLGIDSWYVYHRLLNGGTNPHNYFLQLNGSGGEALNAAVFGAAPTSLEFTIGADMAAAGSAQAFVFGHESGANARTACDGFTTDGSGNAAVSLGWQPQFVLIKRRDGAGDWKATDNARGSNTIAFNSDAVEAAGSTVALTAGGFTVTGDTATAPFIYWAVRA
jgi:hypothetical protein